MSGEEPREEIARQIREGKLVVIPDGCEPPWEGLDGFPAVVRDATGDDPWVVAYPESEAGYASVGVRLRAILAWTKANRPDLLSEDPR
jgi:hypothetical protein